MNRPRRRAGAAVCLAALLTGILAGLAGMGAARAAPAAEAGDGACGPGQGVTVVVDRGTGAEPAVRCAAGEQESGFAATRAAGFAYEFVPQQPGFVCRIDGLPDPCNGAPADAYWSLWTGDGGDWVYATTGAATLRTPVDSAMAWAFGAGEPPAAPVPALSADGGAGSEGQPDGTGGAGSGLSGPAATIFAALLVVAAGATSFLAARGRRRRG